MRVGVVGLGTVGYPLFKALDFYHKGVVGFDKFKEFGSWDDILKCDIVFLCLPTDQGVDGRLDMCVIDEVVSHLMCDGYHGLVVVKSTLRLGYIRSLIDSVSFRVVVFPEWLYAHNSFPGTLSPEMTVVGADDYADAESVLDVCVWHNKSKYFLVTPEEAVMVKLVANGFAATKISFANSVDIICKDYGIDSHRVLDVLKHDPRCSPRYLSPGRAYGGYCLPKDTSELEHCIDGSVFFKGVQDVNRFMIDAGMVDNPRLVKPKPDLEVVSVE